MKVSKSLCLLFLAGVTTASAQGVQRISSAYDTKAVVVPEGLEILHFQVNDLVDYGTDLTSTYYDAQYNVELAFDGNDVYLRGLFDSAPDAWLKGERNNDILSFPSGQYLGIATLFDGTQSDAWFSHIQNKEMMKLKYDESEGTISLTGYGYPYLLTGSRREKIYVRTECLRQIKMKKYSADMNLSTVEIPEDMEVWDLNITTYHLIPERSLYYSVGQMGIYGDDVYVKGLCIDLPEAWLKGKISYTADNNPKVSISTNQYLGEFRFTNYQESCCWIKLAEFKGVQGHQESCLSPVSSIDFDWSPEEKKLTYYWNKVSDSPIISDNQLAYVTNTNLSELSYLDVHFAMSAQAQPNGIEEVTEAHRDRHTSYDLQGCIRPRDAHGLVIEDGRVVLRR